MLVSGFTSTWGQYPWDDLSKRSYHLKDATYRNIAASFGVISLIYFHDPPKWDHSLSPPTETLYQTEIPIIKK